MVVRRKGEGGGSGSQGGRTTGGKRPSGLGGTRGEGGAGWRRDIVGLCCYCFFLCFLETGTSFYLLFCVSMFSLEEKGAAGLLSRLGASEGGRLARRCWFLVGRVDSNDIYLLAVLTAASSRFEFSSCHVKRVRGGLPNLRFIWTTLIFSVP